MNNLGVLERWWIVEWARLQAYLYILFWAPTKHLRIENTYVYDGKDKRGYDKYREQTEYIAVVGLINNNQNEWYPIKEFFGEPR